MTKYIERTPEDVTGKGFEVITYPNGTIMYSSDSVYHRTNGPAVIYSRGTKSWYINGEGISRETFQKRGLDFIVRMQAAELFDPRDLVRMRK